jgi:hypothetical protein
MLRWVAREKSPMAMAAVTCPVWDLP